LRRSPAPRRTLRIAAKHADFTHWFPLGFDALARKTELLERYCAEIGRDPATIERTVTTPVLVAPTADAVRAIVERLPPERRALIQVGTPEQAAEALRPYVDAGFTGFTFNNPLVSTPEAIATTGELLRLLS
jgi:alkanesulfonate monooxygenase SsuD/methylene tetrahydromethanopterin reductase-like flavin-dependent oxidoreductase (luciferase family)